MKCVPPAICSIIVGWWVIFILDLPGSLLLAISLSATIFLLYKVLFLDSMQLHFNWSSRNNFSIKESWKIMLILILLVVFVILTLSQLQKAPILYQPWLDISAIGWVRFIVTLPLVFFFPGYIILKLLDRKSELNKIESFTISPLLSFLVVSLVGFVLITAHLSILSSGFDAFLVFYVALLVSYFVLRWARKGEIGDAVAKKAPKLSVVLILLLVIASVLIIVYAVHSHGVYPGDELQFLGASVGFEKIFPVTNGMYGPYAYWADLSMAFFFVLSGFPAVNSFEILPFLIVIQVLCFFLFAMSFFKKKNELTAIVATVLFTFFAGFGWVYTLMLQNSQNVGLAQAIISSSNKTYDVSNIASQFSFTLDAPELLGFSCILIAFYVVRRQWKSHVTQCILLFAMVTLSYLSHGVIDVIIFAVLFFGYQLLSGREHVHRNLKMGLASIAALLSVALVDYVAPGTAYTANRFGVVMASTPFVVIFSLFAAGLLISYVRSRTPLSIPQLVKKVKNGFFSNEYLRVVLATLILFVYGLSFILYFGAFQNLIPFDSVQYTAFQWPWFTYALRFGVVGFLATGAILYYVLSKRTSDRESLTYLTLWAFVILLACWIGKSLPFLPSTITSMLLENKFQKFLWVPFCLLAAYAIIALSSKLNQNMHIQVSRFHPRSFIVAILVSLVFVAGVSSCLLENNLYYLTDKTSTEELQALNFLSSVMTTNSSVATVASGFVLNGYVGIPHERIFDKWWGPILYNTTSLESVINLLYSYNIQYLYIAPRDIQYINQVGNSYMFSHLLKNLPVVFNNSEVQIYEFENMTPPSATSSLGLVVPQFLPIVQPKEPDKNTVALFHFDETNGTLAEDSVDQSNNGFVVNGSFVAGRFNNGLLLDGVNSYVDCGNNPDLDITSNITIEALVYLNPNWNATGIVAIKAQGTDWAKNNYYFRVDAQRTISFIWGDGTTFTQITSLQKLSVEKWCRLDVEWNKIFIDGNEVPITVNGNATSHTIGTYHLYVGASPTPGSPVGVFNGIIDELSISNSSFGAQNPENVKVYDYYYPVEAVALSNLNYTLLSDVNTDLTGYSTLLIADGSIQDASTLTQWAASGKTLVVLGTRDYGQMSGLFIETTGNNTLLSNRISVGQSSLSFPLIQVPMTKQLEGVTVIANYTNDNIQEAPFALEKSVGLGKIVYIDLRPFLGAIENSSDIELRQSLFAKLGETLSILDLNFPTYNNVNQAVYPPSSAHFAFAEDASFEGNANLTFSEFILPQGRLYANAIKSNELNLTDINIQSMSGFGDSFSTVNSNGGAIVGGTWNYAIVDLSQNFNWSISLPPNSKVEMRISNEKGVSDLVFENETMQISGVYIQSSNIPIEIYAGNLSISVNGVLSFGSFNHIFPFWINQNGIRVIPYSDGGPITLEGTIEFPVYAVGDGAIFINSLTLNGSSSVPQTIPPEQNIDWGNTLMSPVLFILAVASFASVMYLYAKWKPSKLTINIEKAQE